MNNASLKICFHFSYLITSFIYLCSICIGNTYNDNMYNSRNLYSHALKKIQRIINDVNK